MVWSTIDSNNPHVSYILVGLFCFVYSLISFKLQNSLFITESFFSTIFGIFVGSNVLKWFDPYKWVSNGNIDQLTYELSRVILCIQIFTTAIDTPKKFLKYHWKTILLLIIPIMTFGWIVTGAFIKLIFPQLHFTDGLLIAGCITATDPCLSASIMTGHFAIQNVPEILRHIIAVESGINDGMAFPFVYLSLQLIKYNNSTIYTQDFKAKHIIKNWLVDVILYKIVFGAVFGIIMGILARKGLKKLILAEREKEDKKNSVLMHVNNESKTKNKWLTKESIITIYLSFIVLLIGCASTLGIDDLLVAFFAGTAFAWTDWYSSHTEEFKFISSLDFLMNCFYFLYLGSILPFNQFNNAVGVRIVPDLKIWRLILVGLVVLTLRRIPIVVTLHKFMPDVANFKESIFIGHFGAVGVGAIYSCMMAKEFLTEQMHSVEDVDSTEYKHYKRLIYIMWPIIAYIVFISITVHGCTIA
ncbi:Sodium/hydrogen exchanger, partial [Hanseniaspora valbyensis NRRL Y-1626]